MANKSNRNSATHPTETELIALAKSGDQKAFRELILQYQDMVYRFAFNVCRNPEMAADTLQNTLVNVYRKLETFDGRSKFSTWLYSIVTNNCLMKRRSLLQQSNEISFDELENQPQDIPAVSEMNTPISTVLGKELKEVLDQAILKLPLDYRIVFVMRDLEELPAAEVAKALAISVPAVKSRLFRAREFLRKQLQPYLEDNR